MQTKRKTSNIYGQPYDYPKEPVSLSLVRPGDHLVHEKFRLYWHHMIVERIDIQEKKVHVIDYNNEYADGCSDSLKHCSFAKVKITSLSMESTGYYRIVYDEGRLPYSPEETVKLATERIGEKSYNPLRNNCEHFATECKIGKPQCHQVRTLIENALASVLGPLLRFLADFGLSDVAEQITKNISSNDGLSSLWKVLLTKPYKLSKSGVVVAILTELAFFCKDYIDTWNNMEAGKIMKSEFQEAVIKRTISALCATVFTVAASWLCANWLCTGWLATLAITSVTNLVVGRVMSDYITPLITALMKNIELKKD